MEFTRTEKLKAVEREIAMRKRVYPGWVAKGRMTLIESERQIAIMQDIAEDYKTAIADIGP